MKNLATWTLMLLLLTSVQGAFAEETQSITYSDLNPTNSYAEGIAYMTNQGYVSGYDDGSFKPEQSVNRVEALRMILESTGVDLNMDEANEKAANEKAATFPDLEEKAWYMVYVKPALSLEIMKGNDDGTFRPENSVNRAEALKMLVLAANKRTELPNIENVNWYTAYMAYAEEKALLTPNSSGDYLPAAPLSRGELCDLLYRFHTQPYTGEVEHGIASYYAYSFNGHNTASGTALDTYGFMAAHKTLAFGTVVRITNENTHTFVDVTIVDRGPYTEGYIIDLTPAAFEVLAPLSTGILNVRLEVLK